MTTLARWQATITDDAGNVVPNASVEVRRETAGLPLETLYSDRSGDTMIGNPFTADGEGFAAFHCLDGEYQIVATSGAFTRTWNYVQVGRFASLRDTLGDNIVVNGAMDVSQFNGVNVVARLRQLKPPGSN